MGSDPPASGAGRAPNNLPTRRRFIGRDAERGALEGALHRGKQATLTQPASVFGLGGVGKTALALEFAHRALQQGDYPGGVWWLQAEGQPVDALVTLRPILRTLAPGAVRDRLGAELTEAAAIAQAVRLALQTQRAPALLVLDNVDSDWREHLPGGEVRVLITTRDRRWTLGEITRLDVLPPEQARELAEELSGKGPQQGAEAAALDRVVNEELGGLAVAVEMAARAVKQWECGWGAYARLLGAEMKKVLEDPELQGDYRRGVFAALDLSIDRCGDGTPARRLLEGAAVFAPDAVPIDWAEGAAALASGSVEALKARAMLKGLGLLREDEPRRTVSMHRLVHRRVRGRIAPETWRRAGRRGAA